MSKTIPFFPDADVLALMQKMDSFRKSLNAKQKKDFDELVEFLLSFSPEEDWEDDEDDEVNDGSMFVPGIVPRRLTLKVQLKNVKPAVWRKLEVPSAMTLEALSDVINIAMGWTGGHLHGYRNKQRSFEEEDEVETAVGEVLIRKGDKITYEYDFGDSWEHWVELVADPVPGKDRGVRLVSGKNACPPEDFGGPWYYTDFLQAWLNHDRKALKGEFAETMEWLEASFDPTEFDVIPFQEALDDYMASGGCSGLPF